MCVCVYVCMSVGVIVAVVFGGGGGGGGGGYVCVQEPKDLMTTKENTQHAMKDFVMRIRSNFD